MLFLNACGIEWLFFPVLVQPGTGAIAEKSLAEGEKFIQAIEQFNKDTGYYPKSVNDLIPQYLEASFRGSMPLFCKALVKYTYDLQSQSEYNIHFSHTIDFTGKGLSTSCHKVYTYPSIAQK